MWYGNILHHDGNAQNIINSALIVRMQIYGFKIKAY